jgi:hypothetical protein
MALNLPWY